MEDLTKKIREIIDTPDRDVNLEEAALLLLKLNRNRILHDSILRRKNVEKLKYELQKICDHRLKENAAEEMKTIERAAVDVAKKTFPEAKKREAAELKGMRADHDQLPDEIKAKYVENLNIYPRMRKLHEQLKLMHNASACDRYPFLKELKELDESLRKNWDEYDGFVIAPEDPAEKAPENNSPAVISDIKEISAARKYLSDNKTKLAALRTQEDQSEYLALLEKMQKRLALLIKTGAGVSEGQLAELKELGLNV